MTSYLCSGVTWACVAALAAVALFNAWTSRVNQFFFFSRTVAEEFRATAEAGKVRLTYIARVWMGFAAGLLLYFALLAGTRLSVPFCFTMALVLQALFSCFAFAWAHREVGCLLAASILPDERMQPQKLVSVALGESPVFTRKLVVMLLLAPVVAAATWLGSLAAAHMAPGAFMDAIEANKADFLNGLGMGLLAGSILLYIQLRYFSRHRSPLGRFTANNALQLAWLGTVAIALSTLSVPLHLVMTATIKRSMMIALLGFVVLRMIYGWTRARLFPPPQVERNGDEFWRWGMFYYNPADPTLFIQNRACVGYTVNFANFLSWPLTLALLADLVFLTSLHIYR